MNFTNLSPLWVGAGLLGLAGLLYLLQHLRVRYRKETVTTTLFWKAALQDAPVRVFKKRFNHWWAYLLILMICSLLWIAFANPVQENDAGKDFHVLLLDGSAGMARGDAFSQAVTQLQKDVAVLPIDNRQVIWVGADVITLLAPGEHKLLLEKRLQNLKPQAAPASIERQLRHLGAINYKGKDMNISIYSNASISQQTLDNMPVNSQVYSAIELSKEKGNHGIVALGVNQAASGRWEVVDVLIKLASDTEMALDSKYISITVDNQPLKNIKLTETKDRILLSDVPATGKILQVNLLRQDILSLDNSAQLRLPNRPLIKVWLAASLSVLKPLLNADPAIILVDENPDVVIQNHDDRFEDRKDIPVLEFIPENKQQAAFLLTYKGDEDSVGILHQAVRAIGLNQIDTTQLAGLSQKQISISVVGGDVLKFSVWKELLSKDYNFVQSRSFPLFMAKAIRWLAGSKSWYSYVAAGKPLMTEGLSSLQSLGVKYIPASAGQLAETQGLIASLLDPATTQGNTTSALDVTNSSLGIVIKNQDLVSWLLLLALLLLSIEWYFYQKGRMP